MIRSEAFDRFAATWDRALEAGIIAAANAYLRPVKTRLMQGYTSGAFSHGGSGVAGTVTMGAPRHDASGTGIEVGTNVPYAAYWEFGHPNVFTKRYERVEVWRETLDAVGHDMEHAFAETFTRVSDGQPAPAVQFTSDSPRMGPNPAPGFGNYRSGTGLVR